MKIGGRNMISSAMAMLIACSSSNAHAFKAETHVWLAEKILAELKKGGRVSIVVKGERLPRTYTVPASVRKAILNNPEAYRLGSLGPDALPGIIEGQMVIHPGKQGSWGTGDWLAHVLREAETEEEIAFAYGMAAHAAADVWAHSYVNHYAGDNFSVFDGEVNVEARHIALESYIATRTPWELPSGIQPGEAANAMLQKNGRYAIPSEFLFKTFIESDEAVKAFADGGTPHMEAVHKIYVGLGNLARNGGPLDDLHNLIQKAVVYWLTDYAIRQKELEKINRIHQDVLNTGNDAVDKLQGYNEELRGVNRKWMTSGFHESEKMFDNINMLANEIRDINGKKQNLEKEIADAADKLSSAVRLPTINIRFPCLRHDKIGSFFGKAIYGPYYPSICDRIDLNPEIPRLSEIVRVKHEAEKALNDQLSDTQKRLKDALIQTHQTLLSIYDTETASQKAAIDLGQRFAANENPIKGAILAWRADIKLATMAYFDANVEAIGNTMVGKKMQDPLQRWLSCQALMIAAVPGQVLDTTCAVKDSFAETKKLLDTIKRVDPLGNQLMILRDSILKDVTAFATQEGLSYASDFADTDIAALADALQKPGTADNLNSAFSAGTNLITTSSMAQVVDRDIGAEEGGALQPDRFSALYNARTLMTLSLLQKSDTARLFKVSERKMPSNIMLTFAHSIDGDYQWMEKSPPYARASGESKESAPYGYNERFALWQEDVQRKLFRRIFTGPLAPGYLSGSFADALPASYLFRPTAQCSYPTIATALICD